MSLLQNICMNIAKNRSDDLKDSLYEYAYNNQIIEWKYLMKIVKQFDRKRN